MRSIVRPHPVVEIRSERRNNSRLEGRIEIRPHAGASTRRITWVVSLLFLSSTLLPPSIASAFAIVSSIRSIAESGTSLCGCPDDFTTASSQASHLIGEFDEQVNGVGSYASQRSHVSQGLIEGQGGVEVGLSAINDATSRLEVVFTVEQSGVFPIWGQIAGTSDARITLMNDSGVMRFDLTGGAFSDDLMLWAGEVYTLAARITDSSLGTPSGGNWEFTLVPEPSTATLVGLGLLGLAGSGRNGRDRAC